MKTRRLRLWIIVGVLSLTIMSCSLPGVLTSIQRSQDSDVAVEEVISPTEVPSMNFVIPDEMLLQDALVQLYDSVSPGVVSIQVYSQASGSTLGSGFVIDKDGYIVTNYHVVEGASQVEVHFPNGLKVYGEVVSEDLDSDIALIKVNVSPDQLTPIPLGDSDQVRIGQSVVAIGNPYGLSGTMTVGIVSALGRTLESIRQTETGTFFSAGDLIQTDATINPGNSGGPLLNLNGEVIGINRAIQTSGNMTNSVSNTGIGFAVSSNILKTVLPTLKQGESYAYPYLGLSSLPSLTLAEADILGISNTTGAYVLEVVPGGPADQAGVKAGTEPTAIIGFNAGGDLITAVDGQEILEFSELLSYMMLNKHPGDEMVLSIVRDGQELTLTVVLGERPDSGL